MTRGVARTAAVPKARASVYLRRAQNLLAAMREAEERKNGGAVAVEGVQAAISFSDAFTVAKLGLRCRAQDHPEVVRLIATVGTEAASKLASHVQLVFNRRSEVEYGEREVTARDAARTATIVREISDLVASGVQ